MATIVLGGAARAERLFAQPTQALTQDGHTIIRHMDEAAFRQDPTVFRHADVAMALMGFGASRAQLQQATTLRAIVSPVTGTDGFDEQAATEHGILVAHCQTPQNFSSMAEATIMLILAAAYDVGHAQRVLRQGLPAPNPPRGRLLEGKTIGLIGFGRIAQGVAQRLRGWGLRILVHLPRLHAPLPDHVQRAGLDDLLRQSDIVSLHARLTAETRNLLDARRIALMKPTVLFVNTARGHMLDEAALLAFAHANPEARFALDCFDHEPLPPEDPLRALPNAILTPHLAGHTIDTHQAGRRLGIDLIRGLLQGRPPPPENLRNPEILPAWLKRWG